MDLPFLKSPGRISIETFVKIIFISLALIIIASVFTPKTLHPETKPIFSSGSITPAMRGGGATDFYSQKAEISFSGADEARYMPIVPPTIDIAGSPDFPQERKVIRNASLAMVVDDVARSTKDISDLSTRLGGWVENQNVYEYMAGSLQGNLTIRIPEAKFTDALAQLKLLAVRVLSEQIDSSDVSSQVVDLEARLKNERAKEAQYVLILKNAVKISDVLEVTNALSNVRGQIEQLEGQINFLARQTSMSTITISLTPIANAKDVTNEWRPGLVVKESFKNLLVSLTALGSGMIIFFIQVLPILLLQLVFVILILTLLWKVGKRLFYRFGGTFPPPKI